MTSGWTNSSGIARANVSKISSSEKMQMIQAELDLYSLSKEDSTSFFYQHVIKSLPVPAAKVILSVSGLTFYVEVEENNYGKDLTLKKVEPQLKQSLADKGYSFTDDISSADYYIVLQVDTREGGSVYNMFTAYADLNIAVTDMSNGQEIYKSSLSKIKGIDLNSEKAGLKSLNNIGSKLEDLIIPELIDKL